MKTDLARELGVSSGTVRKALNLMVAERLITRRQGRGTFVADPTSDELATHLSNLYGPDGDRLGGRIKSVEITGGTANALECARLHLCASDAVYRIRRILERKDQIYMVEDAMLPAAFFPGLSDKKLIADNVSVLAREYGILVGKAEERVSLGLPPGPSETFLASPPARR